MALNRARPVAPGSYFWSVSVPFIHRPMGRGSGALTWWESFEVAKVAWHRRAEWGGGEERLSLPLLAKAERERVEGRGGGRRIRQHRPAESASPSAPGKPKQGGVDRLLPHGPGRHSPLLLFFFFFPANVYLNARAHTEIVRLFYPSGKKNREWKGREGKAKNSSLGALCTLSHGWARGRCCHSHSHRRLAVSPALRRVPVGARTRALDPRDTERLLAASAAAGRRDSSEKGPATAFPSSAAPAGPRRQPGAGKQGGAEAPEKRAAARPPVDAAPGEAWRQLCRVTRREDCRARGPGGLGAACKRGPRGGAPPHRARSSRQPRAGGTTCPSSPPPRAALSSLRAATGRGAQVRSRGPSRSALRSAAPGGSGTFASVSRASCVHWFFSPPFQPRRAKPPRQRHRRRSPLSLHPIGGLRWPSTRRGWAGCRCLGAPRRPRASDPVVPPTKARAPLWSPRRPFSAAREPPRPGRPPPPASRRRRSRQAGGRRPGRGRGGAVRPEPGARP